MIFILVFVLTLLPVHYALSLFFAKAGKPGWQAWVPGWNYLIFLKLAGRPWYWVLGLLMPGLNLIVFFAMVVAFLRAQGIHDGKSWFRYGITYPYALVQLARDPNRPYIPKKDQPVLEKSVPREWIEAIMFAFVVAQGVKTYIGEPFHIPTSSMEDQLLVGDMVVVSKINYGARVPMTPLSVPLLHNTLPFSTIPSYLSWWKGPEWRLPGLGELERNDIVVFSFPVNDSMVVDPFFKAHSYYDQLYNEAARIAIQEQLKDMNNLTPEQWQGLVDQARTRYLKKYDLRAVPVDKRENFIKRCVAVAGDTLEIRNGMVHIDGKLGQQPERLVYTHRVYYKPSKTLRKSDAIDQGISLEDMAEGMENIRMTLGQADWLRNLSIVDSVVRIEDKLGGSGKFFGFIWPNDPRFKWSMDNFGPVWIPRKGTTISLNDSILALYERCITVYEGHQLEKKNGKYLIDGQETQQYTFRRNYYFMMGDNRHGSLDSRFWGLVPDDHIVGTSFIVLGSLNPDKSGLSKIRNRFFYFPE